MLVGFRGKSLFRQYIPSKPHKYGTQFFFRTVARMLYIYNTEIHPRCLLNGPYLASKKQTNELKSMI